MKAIILYLLFTVLSCEKKQSSFDVIKTDSTRQTDTRETSVVEPKKLSKEEKLRNLNQEILSALKNKDYTRLSTFIHPEKGIRFSMYGFVKLESDKLFSRAEFLKYIETPTRFTWGERDGSGHKLVLSLTDYLENWVFKKDFTRADFYLYQWRETGFPSGNLSD